MSLIYMDGFDSYNSEADMANNWAMIQPGVDDIAFTTGRSGSGQALSVQDDFVYISRGFEAVSVVYFGMAIKSTNFEPNQQLFTLFNGSTPQCGLGAVISGQLLFYKSTYTIPLQTSAKAMKLNKWYYIEGKMTISNSTSADDCIARVNGEEWMNLDVGSDTQVSAQNTANSLRLGPNTNNGPDYLMDDFYILNESGSINNTFLGDVRIDVLRPDGEGNTNNFTGSDADSTNNHLHVDEAFQDGDTSYVESSTVSDIDLYTLDDMPVTTTEIHGIQATSITKKTEIGTRTCRKVIRTNSVNLEGTDFYPSAYSYDGFNYIWDQNLDTTAAWTDSDINALETGTKVET